MIEQVVEALRAARDETVNPEARAQYDAALAEIQRWDSVEGRHTDDGEFRATQMRYLPAGPAILLVRKESDND